MDSISSLSSNLPPETPINENTLQKINSDLTSEFKSAAKSVASLYKLSLQRNSQVKHQGYLDCINDLLSLIGTGVDIENWALMKKLELDGKLVSNSHSTANNENENETDEGAPSPAHSPEDRSQEPHSRRLNRHLVGSLPVDFEFSMLSAPQRRFPNASPIISVDRSNRLKKGGAHIHKDFGHNLTGKPFMRPSHAIEPVPVDSPLSSDEDSDVDDVLIETEGTKRRLESLRVEKRPKT